MGSRVRDWIHIRGVEMQELIAAAKAVIAEWGRGNDSVHDINRLRAAVERAEKQKIEPAGWSTGDGYVYRSYTAAKHSNNGKEPMPLYRHPAKPTGLDQLLERIRFLEQQIAEKKIT